MIHSTIKFLFFIGLLISLGACSPEQDKEAEDYPPVTLSGNQAYIYLVHVKENRNITLKPVKRDLEPVSVENPKMKQALAALLAAPTEEERRNGYGTEIPPGTRLISFLDSPERIDINLSEQFATGGGSRSMILRYRQLAETLLGLKPTKPIYILIEGKELEKLGGEGLIIKNPIQKSSFDK